MATGIFYYFSPTGGTKRTGELFCKALFPAYRSVNLARGFDTAVDADAVVFAVPVFGGRIPAFVETQLRRLSGSGTPCVNLAVYGNRHYDDALLEMNQLAQELGFRVVAAAALIAQHSIVPEAGAGRPDARDVQEIEAFAAAVAEKLAAQDFTTPGVPGNVPYKERSKNIVPPVSQDGCIVCGACQRTCPVGAITIEDGRVVTDAGKCFMCLGCTAVCPRKVRRLPAETTAALTQRLAGAIENRRENEFFR